MEVGQGSVAAAAAQPKSSLSHCTQQLFSMTVMALAGVFSQSPTVFLSRALQQGAAFWAVSSSAIRKQTQHVQVNSLIPGSSRCVLQTLPLLYF